MSGRDTILGDIRSALADVPGAETPDSDPSRTVRAPSRRGWTSSSCSSNA